MGNQNLTPKQKKWAGLLFEITGLTFILMGAGIIPYEKAPGDAPGWILAVCGGVFFLAGISIHMGDKSKHQNLLAGVLVGLMGTIGAWVALFGASGNFSGGMTLLSDSSNISLARWVFGSGALICFATAAYAIRLHFRSKEE